MSGPNPPADGSAATLAPSLFPARTAMTPDQVRAGVAAALAVQQRAVTFGKRPFAAVLVGPDNETVLLSHQSVDQVNHAESSLARLAYCHYDKAFLWQCTLVSTWEPCGMCTATIYVRAPPPPSPLFLLDHRVGCGGAAADSSIVGAYRPHRLRGQQ